MRGKVICPICKQHALFFSSESDGVSPMEVRVEREFAEARLYAHILEQHPAGAARAPVQLKLAYARNRRKLAAWEATAAEPAAAAPEPGAKPRGEATAGPAPRTMKSPPVGAEKKPARSQPRKAAPKPPPGAARGRSGARSRSTPKGQAK
jgi:hypothetical protein